MGFPRCLCIIEWELVSSFVKITHKSILLILGSDLAGEMFLPLLDVLEATERAPEG